MTSSVNMHHVPTNLTSSFNAGPSSSRPWCQWNPCSRNRSSESTSTARSSTCTPTYQERSQVGGGHQKVTVVVCLGWIGQWCTMLLSSLSTSFPPFDYPSFPPSILLPPFLLSPSFPPFSPFLLFPSLPPSHLLSLPLAPSPRHAVGDG